MPQVWRCSEKQGEDIVYEFFKTDSFHKIPVIPGAKEGLATLKAKGFRLVIVTSRQLVIQEATKDWLRRNFPEDTFDEVAFGNHWGKKGSKTSKQDLCNELGASILIDDNYNYIKEVAEAGLHGVLFDLDNTYPWNNSDKLPERAARASSWTSVVDQILKITETSS